MCICNESDERWVSCEMAATREITGWVKNICAIADLCKAFSIQGGVSARAPNSSTPSGPQHKLMAKRTKKAWRFERDG